jgi:hypothetical protein
VRSGREIRRRNRALGHTRRAADGRPIYSCDIPLWSVGDESIRTVEGLGTDREPHPVCGSTDSRHQRHPADLPHPAVLPGAGDHVEFVAGQGNPPLGIGECAQGPTAAAIANAVYDAIGMGVRALPLAADQLIAAMSD